MNLKTIAEALHLTVKSGKDKLETEVRGGYVGDLLSDVMANGREGDIWITRQVHQNIVAVASLKEIAGIILVRGAEPAADTLEKAIRENIPLCTADMPAFEIAGAIYQMIRPKEA
jgi:hypothetical protein